MSVLKHKFACCGLDIPSIAAALYSMHGSQFSCLLLQVADEAASVLVATVQAFSSQWEPDTWQTVMLGPFSYLFELPKSHFAADEDATAVVSVLIMLQDVVH